MYVKSIIENFKKRYGADWLHRYFAWQNAHPQTAAKAVSTASQEGDKIITTLAKTKAGKARARRELKNKKNG